MQHAAFDRTRRLRWVVGPSRARQTHALNVQVRRVPAASAHATPSHSQRRGVQFSSRRASVVAVGWGVAASSSSPSTSRLAIHAVQPRLARVRAGARVCIRVPVRVDVALVRGTRQLCPTRARLGRVHRARRAPTRWSALRGGRPTRAPRSSHPSLSCPTHRRRHTGNAGRAAARVRTRRDRRCGGCVRRGSLGARTTRLAPAMVAPTRLWKVVLATSRATGPHHCRRRRRDSRRGHGRPRVAVDRLLVILVLRHGLHFAVVHVVHRVQQRRREHGDRRHRHPTQAAVRVTRRPVDSVRVRAPPPRARTASGAPRTGRAHHTGRARNAKAASLHSVPRVGRRRRRRAVASTTTATTAAQERRVVHADDVRVPRSGPLPPRRLGCVAVPAH